MYVDVSVEYMTLADPPSRDSYKTHFGSRFQNRKRPERLIREN